MKNFTLLLLVVAATMFTACKKTYNCTATDSTGASVVLQCESCSSKDVDDYKQSILDKGYTSADCEKK